MMQLISSQRRSLLVHLVSQHGRVAPSSIWFIQSIIHKILTTVPTPPWLRPAYLWTVILNSVSQFLILLESGSDVAPGIACGSPVVEERLVVQSLIVLDVVRISVVQVYAGQFSGHWWKIILIVSGIFILNYNGLVLLLLLWRVN